MLYKNKKPNLFFYRNGKVILYLPKVKGNKLRYIGKIQKTKKTFYSTPKKGKIHVFRKTNSLSLPYDLLHRNKKGFIYICINLDGNNLWTSVLAMKKYGEVMQFSKQGFEPQIFLELSKWKDTKKRAKIERMKLKKLSTL